ncbi:formate/nitrite transporter family protein [Tepidanaerobacter sp. GT38]|uniref:formate/nitrite transporter family protein n=1 Tax=Tepidanaerobacter sp. GT38 TaxID=2722793 RepID=UPI001F2750C9
MILINKLILPPAEIASAWIETGEKKANLPVSKMLFLGIFAGIFIGFGAHANIVVTQTLGNIDEGLAKLLGAAVFPVGLMLVIMAGAELFTGNNLLTLALLDGRITFRKMLTNWSVVYLGNFLGSIALALLLSASGIYGTETMAAKAISIANGKVSATFFQAVLRGIVCNMLVVLACWMQAGARDMAGKIFAIWFPIMLFVLSGYEHSIANMFFIPLGMFLGAEISWLQCWYNNLIPVTLGNIIGGAIIVPCVYYYCYKRDFAAAKGVQVNK